MCCADMMSSCVGLRTKAAADSGEPAAGIDRMEGSGGALFRRFGVSVRGVRVLDLVGIIQRIRPGLLVVFRETVFVGPSGNLLGRGSEQRGRMHETVLGVVPNERRARILDPLARKHRRVLARSLDRGA